MSSSRSVSATFWNIVLATSTWNIFKQEFPTNGARRSMLKRTSIKTAYSEDGTNVRFQALIASTAYPNSRNVCAICLHSQALECQCIESPGGNWSQLTKKGSIR